MEEPREDSDQLPEDAPAEQVPDDKPSSGDESGSRESAGDQAEQEGETRSGDGQASGNPHGAG